MKKVLICMFALVLTLSLLAACGNKEANPADTETPGDVAAVKTIGEALALAEDGSDQRATYEKYFVLVFKSGDT